MALRDVIAADRSVFVNPDDFGTEAEFQPADDFPVALSLLFDADYKSVDLATGVLESKGPAAILKEEDAPGLSHGTRFVIDGMTYTVTGVEPDGEGMVLVTLAEVPS